MALQARGPALNMGLLSKCVEAVRRFDSTVLFMGPLVSLGRPATEILTRNPLIVADVGAAGGVDPRWQSLRGLVRFLAFEPRSDEVFCDPRIKRFNTALADRKARRDLHVTRYSQSSSLYPLNYDLLNDFVVRPFYELVRVEGVEVDTLDNCLADHPADRPDFLKVDVEGAELDVLRGGEVVLKESVMGLRTEVSFAPRHIGAPLFGELDAFLHERGYALFILNRELMIRANQVHAAISQPQCVWGDVVYFLTRTAFFARVKSVAQDAREGIVVKFVTMLCAHGVHDYAAEIVTESCKVGMILTSTADDLNATVYRSMKGSRRYFGRAVLGLLFALVTWTLSLPSSKARSMTRPYVRRRASYVLHYLWRVSARGGESDGSVSDLLI